MTGTKKKCFEEVGGNQQGFTLVEVLVALTIFAIGLLALAGMQITGIQGNSRSQSVSAKVALADGVIEEFLAMDGDDGRLIAEVVDDAWEFSGATSVPIEGAGDCAVAVTVDADPIIGGTTHTGLTRIDVTATSPTGSDVTKTIMKRRY